MAAKSKKKPSLRMQVFHEEQAKMNAIKPKRCPGRPSEYSKARAIEICDLMASGKSLSSILRMDGMPDFMTVMKWQAANPEFLGWYRDAHETRMELHADQIVEMSDAEPERNDRGIDMAGVNLQKLRVNSRQWILSKLLPRKYGDVQSIELTGRDGGAVQIEGSSGRGAELLAAWSAGRAVRALPVIEHPSVNADESSDAKE